MKEKTGKSCYIASLIIGGLTILFTGSFFGLGIMLLGLFAYTYTVPCCHQSSIKSEKKPYYKDEFEEYQHYKHSK